LPPYDSAGDRLGEPVSQGKGTTNPKPVTAGGLCAERVNLSIIRGCVWSLFYHPLENDKFGEGEPVKNWGVCATPPITY